jgi:hypothetical protein
MRTSSLLGNLAWGVKGGVAFAIASVAWVGVLVVINGSVVLQPRHGPPVNAWLVILAYLAGGIVAGAVVGLLRPAVRWRLGAALVGMVAAVPVFAGIRFLVDGLTPWARGDSAVLAFCVVVGGGLAGVVIWALSHGQAHEPPPRPEVL